MALTFKLFEKWKLKAEFYTDIIYAFQPLPLHICFGISLNNICENICYTNNTKIIIKYLGINSISLHIATREMLYSFTLEELFTFYSIFLLVSIFCHNHSISFARCLTELKEFWLFYVIWIVLLWSWSRLYPNSLCPYYFLLLCNL
jgi:hypothetical protein